MINKLKKIRKSFEKSGYYRTYIFGEKVTKKQKFMQIYNLLSDKAKRNLVWMPYSKQPMSISVCYLEIVNNTKLGKKILREMG